MMLLRFDPDEVRLLLDEAHRRGATVEGLRIEVWLDGREWLSTPVLIPGPRTPATQLEVKITPVLGGPIR